MSLPFRQCEHALIKFVAAEGINSHRSFAMYRPAAIFVTLAILPTSAFSNAFIERIQARAIAACGSAPEYPRVDRYIEAFDPPTFEWNGSNSGNGASASASVRYDMTNTADVLRREISISASSAGSASASIIVDIAISGETSFTATVIRNAREHPAGGCVGAGTGTASVRLVEDDLYHWYPRSDGTWPTSGTLPFGEYRLYVNTQSAADCSVVLRFDMPPLARGACCYFDGSCQTGITTYDCQARGRWYPNRGCEACQPEPVCEESIWDGPDGGLFTAAQNWTSDHVPTTADQPCDTARFIGNGPHSVQFGGAHASRMEVQDGLVDAAGEARFDIDDEDDPALQVSGGGTLRFRDGTLRATHVGIGGPAAETGLLHLLPGAGNTLLQADREIWVGDSGPGELIVDGAHASGETTIGFRGPGSVTVTGVAGLLDMGTLGVVGDEDCGTLKVEGGARVNAGLLAVGRAVSEELNFPGETCGEITLIGPPAQTWSLEARDGCGLGVGGRARLRIQDGARVSLARLDAAREDGGGASIEIAGDGSEVTTTAAILGGPGEALLEVQRGGRFETLDGLTINGRAFIDTPAESTEGLTPSELVNQLGHLRVGDEAKGELFVSAGGSAATELLTIGSGVDVAGLVSVDRENHEQWEAVLKVAGMTRVNGDLCDAGRPGGLEVVRGGFFETKELRIGDLDLATRCAQVRVGSFAADPDAATSILSVTEGLTTVGGSHWGFLDLREGAYVSIRGLLIGESASSAVTLQGARGPLANRPILSVLSGGVDIGRSAEGRLEVLDGGSANIIGGLRIGGGHKPFISDDPTSMTVRVLVAGTRGSSDDARSELRVSDGNTEVGALGPGALVATEGGSLDLRSLSIGGREIGAVGAVQIANASVLSTAGEVRIGGSAEDATGFMEVAGASSWSGGADVTVGGVARGKLVVCDSELLLAASLIVTGSGELEVGAGTLIAVANEVFLQGSLVSLCLSPIPPPSPRGPVIVKSQPLSAMRDRIRIDGALRVGPEARIVLAVRGDQEGEYDVLEVSGDAALDGELVFRVPDDFNPGANGALRPIRVAGNTSGNFTKVTVEASRDGLGVRTVAGPEGIEFRITAPAIPTPKPSGGFCGLPMALALGAVWALCRKRGI